MDNDELFKEFLCRYGMDGAISGITGRKFVTVDIIAWHKFQEENR